MKANTKRAGKAAAAAMSRSTDVAGATNASALTITSHVAGALFPVGVATLIYGTVTPGLSSPSIYVRLGSAGPVAATITGALWSATITPTLAEVGSTNLAVSLVSSSGNGNASIVVSVESNVDFWFDASNPNCYTAAGGSVTALKSLISGTQLTTIAGSPKLQTDPRNNQSALWLDGASGVSGSDATVQGAVNGTNKPFTIHMVITPDDPNTNGVILGMGNPADVGNSWAGMTSANLYGLETRGSPSGPARDWFPAQLPAGTRVIELHSSDGLNVYGSIDGGAEPAPATQTTPGAITTTNTSIGLVKLSSNTFPFPGHIHEIVKASVDQDAASRARTRNRLLAKWTRPAQIMFVGDSITTAEAATLGGFRRLLHDYCVAQGLKISQQGPLSAGGPYPLRHSAQSGNTCTQMNTRISNATTGLGASTIFKDVKLVLLFAGTNIETDAATTATNYSNLLNTIFTRAAGAYPNVRIAVTPITPIVSSTVPEAYNALLTPIWDAFDAAHPSNKLIRWNAYMALGGSASAALAAGYYADASTHPNDTGYVPLANHPTYGLIQAVAPYLRSISP